MSFENIVNKTLNLASENSRKLNKLSVRVQKLETKGGEFSIEEFEINALTNRSIDGSGNNLIRPLTGMKDTPLKRVSFANYTDGISEMQDRGVNPRKVSNNLCKTDTEQLNSQNLTNMVWAWGQFLDHEIDLTPDSGESASFQTQTIAEDPEEDYPERTIAFKRSKHIEGTEPREYPSVISAFIDATNVYGYSVERAYALREMDGSGKLKTTISDNGEEILPYNTANLENLNPTGNPSSEMFLAGDIRANENVILIAMHTLFVREHNRMCERVVLEKPEWEGQDELIYQYVRRVISGYMQTITYTEFLPALLGPNYQLPKYTGYDQSVDPTIAIEFSTAGYRLGHGMIRSELQIGSNPTDVILLRNAFFNPQYVTQNGIDLLLEGATSRLMKEINITIIDDLRNFLFIMPTHEHLLDLASLNIQRGRDHGLPDYNSVRLAYGLPKNDAFTDITSNVEWQNTLESLYGSVDNIDLWVGCLVEDHLPNSAVGELIATILADQFVRLRDGDRYYFENDKCLSEEMKEEIRDIKLADIINRNTSISVGDDVFHL